MSYYPGYNQSAALLRQWCGRHDGDVTLRSGSNMLYVVFTSDAEGANKGFGIYYRAGEESRYTGVITLLYPYRGVASWWTGCGGCVCVWGGGGWGQ